MQAKRKSNSVVTHTIAGSVITFNVVGAGSAEVDINNLSNEVKERAMVHGIIQRFSDATAISRDLETGKPATPAEKLARMQALVEHYSTGTAVWSRAGAGSGSGEAGLTVRAIAEVLGIAAALVAERIEGLAGKRGISEAKIYAEFRSNPGKVREAYIRLRDAEAKASGINADDLLAELG